MGEVRIFVDAHAFDRPHQGTRTFIQGLYSHLTATPELKIFMGATDVENIKAHFLGIPDITFIKYKSRTSITRLIFEIPHLIRKHGITHAHFQYFVPPVKKCIYLVTIHDVIFCEYPSEFSTKYKANKKFLYYWSAHKADIVTTVSAYSKSSIEKFLRVKKPIHILPNGVESIFFAPYIKQSSINHILKKYGVENYILYVSRLEPRKNHMLLLRSYMVGKLYEKGVALVMIGHKTLPTPELDSLLSSIPAARKPLILMLDNVDNIELLEFYRATRAFVYPSKAEGFGIPPLEAAAVGVPVLCSNSSAMAAFSFFGKFHVNVENEEEFRNKLLEIIDGPYDDGELKRISEIVKQKYSWDKTSLKLRDIIATM